MDDLKYHTVIKGLTAEIEELKNRVSGLEQVLSDDHQKLLHLLKEHQHDHEALEKIEHEHEHDHTVVERLDHSYYTGRKSFPVGI